MDWAFPWALSALLTLPAVWWLMRTLPPPPRIVTFPALRLLRDLPSSTNSPARMPLWLLMLRLLLAACLIVAAAGPVWRGERMAAQTTGPLLLAFDDGWAAAGRWPERLGWLTDRLDAAKRQGRNIYLLPTAPPFPDRLTPLTAAQALTELRGRQPKPWATDRQSASTALAPLTAIGDVESWWLSDGLADPHSDALVRALARLGNGPTVSIIPGGAVLEPAPDPADLTFALRRLHPGPATVLALDAEGRVLGRADGSQGQATLRLPLALRNRVTEVRIEGESSAAATVLLDENSHRRLVGLLEDDTASVPQPLLDSLTYVDKAVQPFAEVVRGDPDRVLAAKPSLLVTASAIPAEAEDRLKTWVQAGGMLLRFANGATTQSPDDALLPSPLRTGGRELGGVLSWTEPQKLRPFDPDSPFAGLSIGDDIVVRRQVLTDPQERPQTKVWARLADGTPLVTARPLGQGWVVLVHVAATPPWSTLPLSGLFPHMLHHLVMMAAVSSPPIASGTLPPVRVLDGWGVLQSPGGDVESIGPSQQFGPNHPPGLYGSAAAPTAFNLGPGIPPLQPLVLPAGTRTFDAGQQDAVWDGRPLLILLALALALADALLTWRWVRVGAVILLVGMGSAQAASSVQTRLAYVITGQRQLDQKSQMGLQSLTEILASRSTANLAAPQGVSLDSPDLAFYPLLYWPLYPAMTLPDGPAVQQVRAYLKHGGLILFDRQDGGTDDPSMDQLLRRLSAVLDLPPLQKLPPDHVLTRSFYLLRSWPGRFTAGQVWIEAGAAENDGVAGVILGSNDWAGEWAGFGDSALAEAAFRFGINVCIYALTGNYKDDQVHLPAILERLGQQP